MNISTVEQYVNQMNSWATLCKARSLSLLNSTDRQRIMDRIESELSPENLTCDGELSAKEVDQRYRYLQQVKAELLSIDGTLEHWVY